MRTRRSSGVVVVLVSALAALAHPACGSGDDGSTFVDKDASGPQDAAPPSDAVVGIDHFRADGACASALDCTLGEMCINGGCCPTPSICGSSCCAGSDVCLFDQCVTPGKDCRTNADCGPGQYCEPGLGGGGADAGAPMDAGDGGGTCDMTTPPGKCLPLPPTCMGDAGADGGCIEACEYHPPVGQLDAVAKWTWGPQATAFPDFTDVWSTPTVGRMFDTNCDGAVDFLDSPSIVFVSGEAFDANGKGTCCQCNTTTPTACHRGVLRMLDGRTGRELWSLDKPSQTSAGFLGFSNAIGDIDGDGHMDIVAASGEGYVVMLDASGNVKRTSDKPIPDATNATMGWGGGLAIADMDLDGHPEIAYGATVFSTTNNAITLAWTGNFAVGGDPGIGVTVTATSTLADVDGKADGHLELVAGKTVYDATGKTVWNRSDLTDGFPAVGDFDKDGKPDVVLVSSGKVWVLAGATGTTELGPVTLPGTGSGGAPTVADFDGDGKAEIGIAQATKYVVLKPNYPNKTLDVLWSKDNHDLSSSVTGSTVFDFEGDGRAEVVYGDECFLWVFDGTNGNVRFAAPHTSFTATEASMLADVDGDGHAEMVMVSNGADPEGWKCTTSGTPTTVNGVTWTPGPAVGGGYRGITVFGDRASSWVGTRTLWNEHTYHVTNVCDDRDTACAAPNVYGSIPKGESKNWALPWLNDFRQNVQDKGLFDAPDAIVSLTVACTSPLEGTVAIRNIGLAALPAGVDVGVFAQRASGDVQVSAVTTTYPLYPSQTQSLTTILGYGATSGDTFYAKVLIDPAKPKFHECREDNDTSDTTRAACTR